MIAHRCLRSRKAYLTLCVLRQQISMSVNNKWPCIGNGSSYRDIRILVLIHYMIWRANRKLGRSVAVDDPDTRFSERQQLFTAHHQEFEGEIVISVEHSHTHLRRYGKTLYIVILEIVIHSLHIPAKLVGKDMNGSAACKRAYGIVKRSVESKARILTELIAGLYTEYVPVSPFNKRSQWALGLDNTLGFSRWTGGIYHIGIISGRCEVRVSGIGVFGNSFLYSFLVKCYRSARIACDVAYSVLGIVGIYRNESRTGFMHTNDRRQIFLAASRFYYDKIIFADTACRKICCNGIAFWVKFFICIAALFTDSRSDIRVFRDHSVKQVKPRFRLVIRNILSLG